MVDLKTAIEELDTIISFSSRSGAEEDFCTTEGEVVIHLRRLFRMDTPDSPRHSVKSNQLRCPNCGCGDYLFNGIGSKNKRCGYCGQTLDWNN